jgi:hypothetical protein
MNAVKNNDLQSFSSWKFDMIEALNFDPRIPAGMKLIAIRILQSVNEAKGYAYISDETICDEVPKTDRYKCNDTPKRLEKLGWWEVERGHGGKASRYRFKDTNLNWILDELLIRREARQEERKRRRLEGLTAKRKPAQVVRSSRPQGGQIATTADGVPTSALDATVVGSPHKSASSVVGSPLSNVANPPPVHLSGTPQSSWFSGEDLSEHDSPRAHAREEHEPLIERPKGTNADFELLIIMGSGSWTRGVDLKTAMGNNRFEYWKRMLAEEGLTASERAALMLEVEEATRHAP